jgi:hypothetical protein
MYIYIHINIDLRLCVKTHQQHHGPQKCETPQRRGGSVAQELAGQQHILSASGLQGDLDCVTDPVNMSVMRFDWISWDSNR